MKEISESLSVGTRVDEDGEVRMVIVHASSSLSETDLWLNEKQVRALHAQLAKNVAYFDQLGGL